MRLRRQRFSKFGLCGLVLVAFLSSPSVFAYPIFFKCEGGRLEDVLDTRDIEKAVNLANLSESKLNSKLVEICAGRFECFEVLKQMLLLSQVTVEAAYEVLEKEIADLSTVAEALNTKISPDLPATAKQIISISNEIHACRKAQEGLDWNSFNLKTREPVAGVTSGEDVLIYHRLDNEYLHHSGIENSDEILDRRKSQDSIGWVILDAVAADVDPYMALAVSFMEARRPNRLVLDPGTLLAEMNCGPKVVGRVDDSNKEAVAKKEKQLLDKIALEEKKSLEGGGVPAKRKTLVYSFGTFHEVFPGTYNPKNSKIVDVMVRNKDQYISGYGDGPALACKQGRNVYLASQSGEILKVIGERVGELSVADACCMKIPYASEDVFAIAANVYLGHEVDSHFSKHKNSPEDTALIAAMAVQGFNGKGPIGLTEKKGVGGFRFGIDTSVDPQYGYQALDTVLNSFINNPMIRALVDYAEETMGRNPKSILCQGKGDGAFAVDSEYYAKKQKDIERLKPYRGKAWSQLGTLQKAAMVREMGFAMDSQNNSHSNLTPTERESLIQGLRAMAEVKTDAERWEVYRAKVYPYRSTLFKTSSKTWKRLEDAQVIEYRGRILNAPSQETPFPDK